MNDLGQHLKQEYKDHIVVVNDKEYVDIDVLREAIYNLAISDAVIGALAMRFGNIEVSEKDIIDYMTEYTDTVEVKFDKNNFTARRLFNG